MEFKDIRKYFNKHFPFDSLLGEESEPEIGKSSFNQFKVSRIKHYIVLALKISPWICGIGLGLSFAAPFVLSYTGAGLDDLLHLWGLSFSYRALFDLVQTVTVGGLIGFGTNWLAIRMLFRPVKKRPIWGQGMIPAQRDIIIDSLAQGMHRHILSQQLIRKRIEESGLLKRLNQILVDGTTGLLEDEELRRQIKHFVYERMQEYFSKEEVRTELRNVIEDQLERKAEKGFKKLVLTTYKRLNRDDYDALIDQVITDIPEGSLDVFTRLEGEIDRLVLLIQEKRRAPEIYMTRFITQLLHRIDIKALLAKQMAHFDEARLEKMVWEATNEQLLYIQYLGTILGILGGLIIWNSYTILVYLGVFGILYLLDELWYKFKKPKAS